jgi:hypothetical protein
VVWGWGRRLATGRVVCDCYGVGQNIPLSRRVALGWGGKWACMFCEYAKASRWAELWYGVGEENGQC